MRLLGISLGTLLIAFIIGLITRFWGLALPYRKFEHPFFNYTTGGTNGPVRIPVLSTRQFTYSPNNPTPFTSKLVKAEQKPEILWTNVYITADKKLISDFGFDIDAFLAWAREKNQYKGKYLHSYTLDELTKFWSELVPMDIVVKSFPNHQFVLNILSNDLGIHQEIVSFVEAHKLDDRVLISSTIDIIIKAIKELRPMWIYGTSISEVSRIKSFSTLGIEPAISIRGDVFVAPVSYLSRQLVDQSLVNEMKRRKKFVFLGPLASDDQLKIAEDLQPDAIIY